MNAAEEMRLGELQVIHHAVSEPWLRAPMQTHSSAAAAVGPGSGSSLLTHLEMWFAYAVRVVICLLKL